MERPGLLKNLLSLLHLTFAANGLQQTLYQCGDDAMFCNRWSSCAGHWGRACIVTVLLPCYKLVAALEVCSAFGTLEAQCHRL